MSDTIKIGYSSGRNITFRGELETDLSVDEWREMSEIEQDEFVQECLVDIVDIYPIVPGEET